MHKSNCNNCNIGRRLPVQRRPVGINPSILPPCNNTNDGSGTNSWLVGGNTLSQLGGSAPYVIGTNTGVTAPISIDTTGEERITITGDNGDGENTNGRVTIYNGFIETRPFGVGQDIVETGDINGTVITNLVLDGLSNAYDLTLLPASLSGDGTSVYIGDILIPDDADYWNYKVKVVNNTGVQMSVNFQPNVTTRPTSVYPVSTGPVIVDVGDILWLDARVERIGTSITHYINQVLVFVGANLP